MRVVCGWCRREGRPGALREVEPLDDPMETHGICAWHERQFLAELPSESFRGVDMLIVVKPSEQGLYDYLTHAFEPIRYVRVIVDRRRADRRRQRLMVPADRRRGDRRLVRGEPYAMGYTAVRFGRSG